MNINVTDVNDNPPRFEFPSYKFEFKSRDATEIGRVKAIDEDLGSGGIVKYRLLEQTEVSGVLYFVDLHFTFVCLMPWPLSKIEAKLTSYFSYGPSSEMFGNFLKIS